MKPEKEKKPLGRGARIALVGLTLLGIEATGAVIAEQINNQPFGVVRTLPTDLKWPITLPESLLNQNQKVPDTFINKEGEVKFGEANVVKITPQEAEGKGLTTPTITVDAKTGDVTVTTLLPGIFPSTIPDIRISSETQEKKGQAPYVKKNFIMPEGYQLTIPKGAHYALFKTGQDEANRDPNLVYTVVVFFHDPISNMLIRMVYESTGFVPGNGQEPIDRKTYNQKYNSSYGVGDNSLKLQLPTSDGNPIAKPASSNQPLNIFFYVESDPLNPSSSVDESIARHRNVLWNTEVNPDGKLTLISSK